LWDGRIIISGGNLGTEKATTIYDPVNNEWTIGPTMETGRGYHSMSPLNDGRIFTLGGSFTGGKFEKNAEVYDPSTNSWTTYSGIIGGGSMRTKDIQGIQFADNHMWQFQAPNGLIFHAGPSHMMHWIDLNGGVNGNVTQSVLRGNHRYAMNGNAVMYEYGKILTLGGSKSYNGADGAPTNEAYVIDILGAKRGGPEPTVTQVGSMKHQRCFSNSVILPSGQVLVVGGQSPVELFANSGAVFETEIWDPSTRQFTVDPKLTIQIPRNYHSIALLMKDGRVLSGGGGLCYSNCDAYSPNVSGWKRVKNSLSRHFIICSPVSAVHSRII